MTRKLETYEISFELPGSREDVFRFVSDVDHLDLMTPDWLRFSVRTPDREAIRRGTIIDYRLRWHRLPLRWRSEITEWRPDSLFTYEQRIGPYRQWIHEHRFEDRAGGTRVVDRVDYAFYGSFFFGQRIGRDIAEIFKHRVKFLQRIFEPQA